MTEVLPRDILVRACGRTLQRTGFLAAMGAGRVEVKETFTRPDATTCRTFTDRDVGAGGIMRLAAANLVRIEYPGALSGLVDQFGYPYCGPLPEGIRTNSALRSEELDNAAWANVSGTPVVTPNDFTAPDGALTCDKVEDDDAAVTEHRGQSVAIVNDSNTHCVSIFLRKRAGAPSALLQLFITGGAPSVDARIIVNPATGAFLATNNVNAGVINYNASFWRVWITAANNTSANTTLRASVGPAARAAGDVTTTAQDATQLGFNHAWGLQIELNCAFPSSYMKTVAATVTSAADAITLPLNIALQALTIHCDFLHPSSDAGVRGVFHIGAAGVVSRLFDLNWSGTKYRVTHGDAATGYVEASAVATPSPGDRVRVAACLYPDGHVSIEQAINSGAAAAVVANATTKALTAITQQVLVGRRDVGLEQYGPILESKLIRNVRTLAECEVVP